MRSGGICWPKKHEAPTAQEGVEMSQPQEYDHASLWDDDDVEPCYECGDEGWIVDDCFEDSCCCADPETQHDIIPCPVCNPEGNL